MTMDVPTINYFPEEFKPTLGQDKFVQFNLEGRPLLRLGSDKEFHADIVQRFCEELGLEFRIEKGRDIRDIVYPTDPLVDVVGAGYIYRLGGDYFYHGDSVGYGLKPDVDNMEQIANQFPDKVFVLK